MTSPCIGDLGRHVHPCHCFRCHDTGWGAWDFMRSWTFGRRGINRFMLQKDPLHVIRLWSKQFACLYVHIHIQLYIHFAPKDVRQSINPSIYSISSETKILEYFYTSHLRGLASWCLEAGWLYLTLENREFQMFWTDFISGRKASEFGFCKLVSRHFWQIIRSHIGSIPTIHLKFLNMGTSEVFNFSRFGGWLMFLLLFFSHH